MPRFSGPKPFPAADIRALDKFFNQAGLVRSRHDAAPRVARPTKLNHATPEDFPGSAAVPQVAPNGVQWFRVRGWERFSWLWHGFSTRKGGLSRAYCADDAPGELNLGLTPEDERETVLANRRLLAEAITGSPNTPLSIIRQFHSHHVIPVATADSARISPCRGDGQITDQSGLLLAIQTADCIPVLVADRKRRVVAAFHAGWRGTVNRIVETGIGRMRLEFGSRPEDMVAAIGPGVGACCYAVGEEVFSEFESQFLYGRELFHEVYSADAVRSKSRMRFLTQQAPGCSPTGPSLHLDLIEANRRQLLSAGLETRSIKIVPGCTNCRQDLFFSYRGSNGRTGRMMTVIGIRGS